VNMSGPVLRRALGECWEWTGHKVQGGYGQFDAGSRTMLLAHRASWQLENGPIPEGMNVLHRCDNPACVRPAHLFVGSAKDNMQDMLSKGRDRIPFGSEHGSAKLTEDSVRRIRLERSGGRRLADLAAEFGVAECTISEIARRRTWKHVS
jgi:hypothetical protein